MARDVAPQAIRTPRSPLRRLALLAPLTLILVLLVPSLAAARPLSDEEREGRRVLDAVRDGNRDCGELSREDFIAAGDYAMGRRFPTARAHEAMDELMRQMMGGRGQEQMHEYLGRQATGCGGGQVPAGLGGMMGMMGGTMDMMGGAAGNDSMMGRATAGRFNDNDDDDWGGAAILMTVLMALLVVIAAAAVWRWRPEGARPGAGETPLDALSRRFASGEIDADEYRRRRDALGGAA